jgi:hypothetical protein
MYHIISHISGTFFFFATILICFLIAKSKIGTKDETQSLRSRETEANAVRRKDISALAYIRIPVGELPLDALLSHNLKKLHDTLLSLSEKNILNLSAYTNTDLKMMYGPANLEELSGCDENFTILIRTLQKAGEKLAEENDNTSAMKFLEYAVSIGSDISGTYELLGRLYLADNNTAAFDTLYQKAEGLSSISKPVIINKLNTIKSD